MSDPRRFPQILTKTVVPSLTSGLDAGDVLECYLLRRTAYLHRLANSSIAVQKNALGLRYRPPSDAASMHAFKQPLELTLEYGPMRAGSGLQHESIPRIIRETELNAVDSFVSWENEAKVYYTTSISADIYHTANYMASLTGAVLSNLLEAACDYPKASRRRYQPFAVYNGDRLLLRSSSDLDFMHALWKHLAKLGVELQPVLRPPQWEVRLNAVGVDKVQVGTVDVSRPQIAYFYSQLYECLEAIATANYSSFRTVDSTPTVAPSIAPSTNPPSSKVPSSFPTIHAPENTANATNDEIPPTNATFDKTPPRRAQNTTADETANSSEIVNETAATSDSLISSIPSASPSTPPPVSHSEEAAKAAAEAQQAANEAQVSGNTEAAHAAQAAATAAQKAAEATADQAASITMGALLSGDGDAMSQASSFCFQDPLFGLSSGGNVTTAYLYWDGSFYYRVNLTAPYITVAAITADLPQPPRTDGYVAGDLVDWALALLLLGMVAFGLLLLLQQVLGRNFHIIRPLYKFQRWFFDPLAHAYDDLNDEDEATKGRGQKYTFGEDVIPLSMGGRKAPSQVPDNLTDADLSGLWRDGSDDDDILGDMELVGRRKSNHLNGSEHGDSFEEGSESETGGLDIQPLEDMNRHRFHDELSSSSSSRFLRDPNLVELPNLKSKSKVAVPVSLVGSSNSLPSQDELHV